MISAADVISSVKRAMEILELSENENLRRLLLEIARTESGRNPRGSAEYTHHSTNPFQLTNIAIKQTQESSRLRDDREKIARNSTLQNPWSEQSTAEIKNNVKMNALAGLLYVREILKRYKLGVPATLKARGELWKNYYNTSSGAGDSDHYVNKNKDRLHEVIILEAIQPRISDSNISLIKDYIRLAL